MERIVFSNTINETEFLRTLAKYGTKTLGLRVLNDTNLCSYILMKSAKLIEGRYIPPVEEKYIYFKLMGLDIKDCKNLKDSIDHYRECVLGDVVKSLENNLMDDFKLKKDLILEAYKKYTDYKMINSLYDKLDMMDYILKLDLKLDMECVYFKEETIAPKVVEILNKIFTHVEEISIASMLPKENKDIHFMSSFGRKNEIDYVFNEIHEKQYALDDCEIVVMNSDYLNYIKDYDVPYTSALGIPVIETNAGILLKYLLSLKLQSYGVDGYRELFSSLAFDTTEFKAYFTGDNGYFNKKKYSDFIKYAGWLRIGEKPVVIHDELYDEKVALALHRLYDVMQKGFVEFIRTYSPQDSYSYTVCAMMDEANQIEKEYGVNRYNTYEDILAMPVDGKLSEPGKVHVTNLNKALSSKRKYIFIVGLDSDFPGNPKEDYLVYDLEYDKTGYTVYQSKNKVEQIEFSIRSLIENSDTVYIMYPYFDTLTLKNVNPSSIVYDLYPGAIEDMPKYGYKDSGIAENTKVIEKLIQNENIKGTVEALDIPYDSSKLLSKSYSPSKAHDVFNNKLSFIINGLMGINIDDSDNPYDVISPSDKGTLVHQMMEGFDKKLISKEDFLKKAEKCIDDFYAIKPPMISLSGDDKKKDILYLAEKLYDMDNGNTPIYSEEKVSGRIEELSFYGTLDRLEKTPLGSYILVDYKTGTTIRHKDNDVESCLQGLIYANLLEQTKGIKVERIEFVYPYPNKVVSIAYSDSKIDEFKGKIRQMKELIDTMDFSCDPKGEYSYCEKYEHLFSLMKAVKA